MKENLKEVNTEIIGYNIIVIRKSWWSLICGSLFKFIFWFIFTLPLTYISSGLWLFALTNIFIFITIFNLRDIKTSKLEINLKKKEAFFENYRGSDVTKEIGTIRCYCNPIFPMYNSIVIRGKGYGTAITLSVVKEYDKIKQIVDKFYLHESDNI